MKNPIKLKRLNEIYDWFEAQAFEFKKNAACKKGCAFCCTHFGYLDITTLEGITIQDKINCMPKPARSTLSKKLAQNKRLKENQKIAKCPFLNKNNTCLIYDIRPFSCRQLYSLKECGRQGPTVHRPVMELAKKAIKKIQQLDDTGYSGHMSYILHLLSQEEFKRLYLAGDFVPERILDFGKSHGIVINRMMNI
jgi:Fe-S-cluster containining protein